jgi:hypothetical protein
VQEVQEVIGIRSGGIEADDEVHGSVALHDPFEALPELGIAVGVLGEGEFGGSGLQVVVEEGGIMTIA